MSEKTKSNLDAISEKLSDLPKEVAETAVVQYAIKMDGYVEGFAAGLAYSKKED